MRKLSDVIVVCIPKKGWSISGTGYICALKLFNFSILFKYKPLKGRILYLVLIPKSFAIESAYPPEALTK